MDCFIIRVYRRITHQDGQPDEIAGLVEHVGRHGDGKPFTSYTGLVSALREEYGTGSVDDGGKLPKEETARMRLVNAAKQR